MKINIEELESIPDKTITLNFNEKISELENDSPVSGTLTISSTGYGAEVEGHVATDIVLECDRCLERFTYHIDVDIDEKFVKDRIISEERNEIELTSEDFVEELKGSKEIDVTDLVYQSIILNVPTKKLCDIECEGTEEYQKLIKEKPIDPRLEIFKKLSDKMDK